MASIFTIMGLASASSILTYVNKDSIQYNVSLLAKMAIDKCNKNSPWWSKINDNIYIGAVPLKKHEKEIVQLIGLDGHILSIMRKHENNYDGIIIKTIKPKRWKNLGIEHRQIESPDYRPLSYDKILQAIEYIYDTVNNKNKKIYVHCKAGHGRSVIAVICYLIKYNNMTVDNAIHLVKSKRNCININSEQKNCILNFKTQQENIKKIDVKLAKLD